ncbi:hypothetical protein BT96DRAFT_1017761 [Gymnopus androsaceus JB14]|uniref:Uncharacterized protein n=1 Tax=Gymnopus androsaceus JB14 TaxID=1447944 RepID=A0A6A4HZQ0_9AGAR|nr:hypothetical protein BT96DRAFT_1017761 [Gymnopus androsaceus JB14]
MNRCQRAFIFSSLAKESSPIQEDLAVHVRKIENVPTWLQEALNGGPSGKLRKYRRLLGFDGTSSCKSATIRVLSKELNFEVLEWSSSTGSTFTDAQDASSSWIADDPNFTPNLNYSSSASKLSERIQALSSGSELIRTSTPKSSSSNHRVILLEDYPTFYTPTLARSFTMSLGDAGDERLASGAWGRDQDGAIDIRTLLPKDVLHGPYVHEIRFNPIAPTLMKKALQALVTKHYALQKSPVTGSNTIYADSPIDSSLFSLYIRQNFTQFCTDVDECDGIADWLSWADSSGGEAAMYSDIKLTHIGFISLPLEHYVPYRRRYHKEKEAWEGVWDVRSWIVDQGAESGWNLGAWTPRAIATDLGGVLRARDATSFGSGSAEQQVPPRHRTFSSLKFVYPKANMKSAGREQLGETDDGEPYSGGAIVLEEQQEMGMWKDGNGNEPVVSKAEAGGWLEGDDIEDF